MSAPAPPAPRLLVLFDGRCGFCNAAVRWLLRRDRHDRLRFAPAGSPLSAPLLRRNGLDAAAFALAPGTLLVVRDSGGPRERVLLRSTAVAILLAELPGPWPVAAAMLRAVPRPLRDGVYNCVARIRYRIGGKLAACPLPTPLEEEKFL